MSPGGLRTLEAGRLLARVHPRGKGVLFFGPGPDSPPEHRFDAPDGSYGVCYLAHTARGAFAETFLRDPETAGRRIRILTASTLAAYEVTEVELNLPLQVARLHGPGLAWRGVTASVSSTPLYEETRELSARIHAEPPATAGIEYRCRQDDDELAVALFDRARPALRPVAGSSASCLSLARRLEGVYPFVVDGDA